MLICTYLVDIFLISAFVFKGRTKLRAEAKNVNTARLPIDEYMERKSEPGNHSFSIVLTVNQGTVCSRYLEAIFVSFQVELNNFIHDNTNHV